MLVVKSDNNHIFKKNKKTKSVHFKTTTGFYYKMYRYLQLLFSACEQKTTGPPLLFATDKDEKTERSTASH